MTKKVVKKINLIYWHKYFLNVGKTCNKSSKSAQELFLWSFHLGFCSSNWRKYFAIQKCWFVLRFSSVKTAVDLLEIEVTFSHRCQGGGGDTGAVSKMHPTLGQINTFLYNKKYTYICIFFKVLNLTILFCLMPIYPSC